VRHGAHGVPQPSPIAATSGTTVRNWCPHSLLIVLAAASIVGMPPATSATVAKQLAPRGPGVDARLKERWSVIWQEHKSAIASICVDGRLDDWATIPAFDRRATSASSQKEANPIEYFALIPTRTDVRIAARLATSVHAPEILLSIECLEPASTDDFHLLVKGGACWISVSGSPWKRAKEPTVALRRGSDGSIELRCEWSTVATAMGVATAEFEALIEHRGWVRVFVSATGSVRDPALAWAAPVASVDTVASVVAVPTDMTLRPIVDSQWMSMDLAGRGLRMPATAYPERSTLVADGGAPSGTTLEVSREHLLFMTNGNGTRCSGCPVRIVIGTGPGGRLCGHSLNIDAIGNASWMGRDVERCVLRHGVADGIGRRCGLSCTLSIPWSVVGSPRDGDEAAAPWFLRLRMSLMRAVGAIEFAPAGSAELLVAGTAVGAARSWALARTAEIRCPVNGRWYIAQPPLEPRTHGQRIAWDLSVVDDACRGRPRAKDGGSIEYAFGAHVVAPVEGRVALWSAGTEGVPAQESKEVAIVDLDGAMIRICHLHRGSLGVRDGERVTPGQRIAVIGRGGTSEAHLHVEAWRGNSPVAIAFRRVRVGLNPQSREPWSVDMSRWAPEAGLFIESIEH
jgi:hypothetical protein